MKSGKKLLSTRTTDTSMPNTKDSARRIVEEILHEVEKRYANRRADPAIVSGFLENLSSIQEKVFLDCSDSIPEEHITSIQDLFGEEIIEVLSPGKLGSLVLKDRDRLHQVYKKLSVFAELHRYAVKEAKDRLHESWRLKHVLGEMVESQIAHVQEAETLEQRLHREHMINGILLAPFEKAMSRITEFLNAGQIDVFLFDEDSAPGNKLKATGKSLSYTREQERLPDHTKDPEISLCQDGREAICEAPLMVEDRHIGHWRIRRIITDDFDRDRWTKDVELMSPVAARIIQTDQDSHHAGMAFTDELTQLYNRRKLSEQMGRLFKQFKTSEKKLFVAMINIDRFKELNDLYGHPAGDEVLRKAAQLMRDGMPYAYRYDNDIFCGLFYGLEQEEVLALMEDLRKGIEQAAFVHAGLKHRITISCGIAEFETSMNSVMDAGSRANIALSISKKDGRNCCSYYDDIKDRYLEEASQLREKNRLLEEELKGLREKLARKKMQRH